MSTDISNDPEAVVVAVDPRPRAAILSRHPRLRLAGLLIAPATWLIIAYIVALASLLITALWTVDTFTGIISVEWTLDNIRAVLKDSVYYRITARTIMIALAVTVIDMVLALPVAFFIAKVAHPRRQKLLIALVLMPLWAGYLVKAYAWRSIFTEGGLLDWLGKPFGLGTPGYSQIAVIVTLAYIWLPYMILPVHAGFERIPDSLLEASGDLGAGALKTMRMVVVPLLIPAVVAGSIFTFSLSLGDYITTQIVGGRTQMIGNVVYANIGAANNIPFAAAVALIPIVITFAYLLVVRRIGALKNI